MNTDKVKAHYREKETEIEKRLEQFRALRDESDYRLFIELVFVILSSQTEAHKAWKATEELDEKNLLMEGNKDQIAKILERNGVSYEENKAEYVVGNREFLSQPTLKNPTKELKLKEKLDLENLEKTREWLVENIKGISWKGASHFLRNIGYGDEFAIVSSYISQSLFELELLEEADLPKDKEEYLKQEEKMKKLAEETGIDILALDLTLWSMETGEVFK
ncbi:MAG: hypothetical protein BRC29_00455 [Nanohaloarchaea archaeon SW_7_43_1]|nr:MAG: hypothetical protein BRC29_00455 [Nanohaloarchaea archaeon SW_7_43_1]